MKRKIPNQVSLTWSKNKLTGHYELVVDGQDIEDGCMARVMAPDSIFNNKDYHFAIWRPKEAVEKREHMMYGHASSFDAAVRMAEAAIDNRSWWKSKKLAINRDVLSKSKIERKKVTRR